MSKLNNWDERVELARRRCAEFIDLDQEPPVKYISLRCKTALAEIEELDKLHKQEMRKEGKYPMEKGEREMWAVLGRSGGIYAFAHSFWKAKEIQRDYWNIGSKKPIKYLIKFERI